MTFRKISSIRFIKNSYCIMLEQFSLYAARITDLNRCKNVINSVVNRIPNTEIRVFYFLRIYYIEQ